MGRKSLEEIASRASNKNVSGWYNKIIILPVVLSNVSEIIAPEA